MIREVIRRRLYGIEHLTYNVFNLRLDFDARLAIIEDDLDPGREEQLPLDEFAAAVERA